jgi:adenylate kinase
LGVRVVVVGIAGVGKSTVIDQVSKKLDGTSVQVFGTVMFEEAKRLKWVKHRDEMRKMPVEKQKRLQRIAAQKLSRSRGRFTVVDTHLFIRTNEGFWPGLPFDVIKALKPTHLVLIEATPDEILSGG